MPTYQYACTSCGAQLEVVQKFSDDPLTECPECAGRLRKVFSAVGVVFKGSGFYHNDSRSDSKSKPGSSTSKSDSGTSETKSDAGSKTESSGSASKSDSSTSASTGSSSSSSGGSSSKSEKVA